MSVLGPRACAEMLKKKKGDQVLGPEAHRVLNVNTVVHLLAAFDRRRRARTAPRPMSSPMSTDPAPMWTGHPPCACVQPVLEDRLRRGDAAAQQAAPAAPRRAPAHVGARPVHIGARPVHIGARPVHIGARPVHVGTVRPRRVTDGCSNPAMADTEPV